MTANGFHCGQEGRGHGTGVHARPPWTTEKPLARLFAAFALCFMLAGCTTAPRLGERLGETLGGIGLKRSNEAGDETESALRLRMHAAPNLNGGSEARPLALVVKLYHLRDHERFQALPFDAFLDEAAMDEALGRDLLQSREVLLLPNQRYDVLETLAPGATHLGVVALFRNPADTRWRFVFGTGDAAANGLLVGLHACAMTTTSDALVTRLGSPAHTLSATACPR
jgi:type VI secretion system protein VasD